MTRFSLLNIIYTNDMTASVAFYEALGLDRKIAGEVDPWWNEFTLDHAALALHWNEGRELATTSNPELHLQVAADEFDAVYDAVASLQPSGMQELEGLGRYFVLTDPNGVRVQINEVN